MEKRKRKPGGGRKPAAGRKVNRTRSFYLYEDQVERVTPEEVRRFVDAALAAREFVKEIQNKKQQSRPK